MPNFLFVYHGGSKPETPEAGEAVMAKWNAWFAKLGEAVVDGGAPVGPSTTVFDGAIEDHGGSNPTSGYSIVKAADKAAAVKIAQGCPVLDSGGNIEVAEAVEL